MAGSSHVGSVLAVAPVVSSVGLAVVVDEGPGFAFGAHYFYQCSYVSSPTPAHLPGAKECSWCGASFLVVA